VHEVAKIEGKLAKLRRFPLGIPTTVAINISRGAATHGRPISCQNNATPYIDPKISSKPSQVGHSPLISRRSLYLTRRQCEPNTRKTSTLFYLSSSPSSSPDARSTRSPLSALEDASSAWLRTKGRKYPDTASGP
jgi:hypothetical protein